MIRRDFLTILAGSPFVFGLRELFGQDAPSDSPDWFKAALKRMKETRRYGVLLVIPPGKEAQARLGQGLMARFSQTFQGGNDDIEIFVANVFICLSEARARQLTGGKLEGDGTIAEGVHRVLLDPEGRRVAADRVDPSVLEDSSKFRESFRKLVAGDDGSRLRNHAREIEKTLPDEILKAVDRISRPPRRVESGQEAEELRGAMDLVKGRIDSIAPWLAHLTVKEENEKSFLQTRLRSIFREHCIERSFRDPDPSLPFGIKVEAMPPEDPCPPCGRSAILPGKARKFLSFFEK